MQKRLLNMQADKIEMVLAAHKAPARVWGGRLTARTVQFHLAPAATTKLHTLQALTEELALALGTSSARLTRQDGTLSLEVPRPDAQVVPFADLVQRLHADEATRRALGVAGTAVLGLDQAGVPLLLRLAAPEVAHCLIAGTTGSGKTELVRTLVASLLLHQRPHDLQVALFDPKGRGLAPFAGAPHLLFPVVVEPGETLYRMQSLVSEMERREREGIERPRLVVVVDELADLLQSCGVGLEGLVRRLVQRGRSAGLSVVACAQKPSAQAVGSVLKANFPVRLVGKVASAEDARVAAGVGGTRAERLAGRGDFLLIVADQQIRFQAARIPPEELSATFTPGWLKAEDAEGIGQRVLSRLRRIK